MEGFLCKVSIWTKLLATPSRLIGITLVAIVNIHINSNWTGKDIS